MDRMLIDYLLRMGYTQSATQLAHERGIEDLVDVDAFMAAWQIEESLRQGRTHECLAWCNENKRALKDMEVGSWVRLVLRSWLTSRRATSSWSCVYNNSSR